MKALTFLISWSETVVMPLAILTTAVLILTAVLRPPSRWKCGAGADAKILARYDAVVHSVAAGLAWLLGILTASLPHF